MPNGYIKISRQLMEHDDYLGERFDRMRAWIDLLLLAVEDDCTNITRCGEEIKLVRGQLAKPLSWFAARWQWPRSSVDRYLTELEKKLQIYRQDEGTSAIITIVNYDKYNGNGKKRRAPKPPSASIREKNEALLASLDVVNDNYGRFIKFVHDYAHDIIFIRMEMPTKTMFDNLRNRYGPIRMRDIIADMVNKPSATAKYVMLGTTMKNWLQRRYG